MKMYNNGQRKSMMYGGGASMRKPMMYGGTATKKKMNMGGLADQNRKTTTGSSAMMNPMGSMTEKKKFSMGMMYGGSAMKKEKMLYGGQAKIDMNKNNRMDKEDFDILRKKK